MVKPAGAGRIARWGGTAAAVGAVFALLVFLTLLSERYYLRWDVTATDENTLSTETVNMLKKLDEPVSIKAFLVKGGAEAEKVQNLLAAYQYLNRNIRYEVIDPVRSPAEARRYDVKSEKTLILEGYGRSQTVRIPGEEKITNALYRLMESAPRRICWLTGHGERAFKGDEPEAMGLLAEALGGENMEVVPVHLMREDLPDNTAAVVLADPRTPLFPEEIRALEANLADAGRLLIFLEPFSDGGLAGFLAAYGIGVGDEIIVDKFSRVMGGDYLLPMVNTYGAHEITQGFDLTSIFRMGRPLSLLEEKGKALDVTCLAFTSEDAWAEIDRAALDEGRVAFEKEDTKGPLCLAAAVETGPGPMTEAAGESKPGRMVVFGDCDFASNQFLNIAGNRDFALNAFRYLVGRPDAIVIEPRRGKLESLMLSRLQGLVFLMVPVFGLPLAVIVAGVWVWLRRRPR